MKLNKEQKTKLRIEYAIVFILLLLIEVFIALFVHDKFIRPYVGDALVVIVLYFAVRIIIPKAVSYTHLIPTNKNNMAYDVWINVKKDTLINILKTFN